MAVHRGPLRRIRVYNGGNGSDGSGRYSDKPVGGREEVINTDKRGKKEENELANLSYYSPCWASHFAGFPFICEQPVDINRETQTTGTEGRPLDVDNMPNRGLHYVSNFLGTKKG